MLPVEFYEKSTVFVARSLLGKVLVVKNGEDTLSGKIVETEAYVGPEDRACHASWRKRETCKTLWGPPGFAYVYLTYGIHWMLNIVTEKDNYPSAVLVRALEPLDGKGAMRGNRGFSDIFNLTSGPAKLTKAFGINRSFDGKSLLSEDFHIVDEGFSVHNIITAPRIGVDYASEPWRSKLWRFYDGNSKFVSRR